MYFLYSSDFYYPTVGGFKCYIYRPSNGGVIVSSDVDIATKRLKLKIALEELREMKGFGTELVTIIIPPDRQVSDARSMLQNEHGQAANIKSKGTRKNVQGAIESAIGTFNKYILSNIVIQLKINDHE